MEDYSSSFVKEEKKNYSATKAQGGWVPSCLVPPFLEQSSKMMPAAIPPKSDQHAFQPLTTQSVLSVHKKAVDSCLLLHSAFGVLSAHSPRPCTHTHRERETWPDCALSLLQRHSGLGPLRPLSGHVQSQLWCILHICSIFKNCNNPKRSKKGIWILWRGRRQDSDYSEKKCLNYLATTKLKSFGSWLIFLIFHLLPILLA